MAKVNAIADLLGAASGPRPAEGYVLVDYRTQLIGRDDNREVNPEAVRDLAESIERDGLAQPILAREIPGREAYELIAGQHRCAAYRLLSERHPDQAPKWDRIECKVVRGMDDGQAWRLMLATNVVDANHAPAERGRMLLELYGARATEIQAESGGRRREIIRDLYEQETGRAIGVNTVQRALQAHEDEQAAKAGEEDLSPYSAEWLDDAEFGSLRPKIRHELATLSTEEQSALYARWSERGRPKAWLADRLALASGRAPAAMRRSCSEALYAAELIRDAVVACPDCAEEASCALADVSKALREAVAACGAARGEGSNDVAI